MASETTSLYTVDLDELTILGCSILCYSQFLLAKQARPGMFIEHRSAYFETWVNSLERYAMLGRSLDDFCGQVALHAVKSRLSDLHDAVKHYIENPPTGELDEYGRDENLRNIDEALIAWSAASLVPARDGGDELAELVADWQPYDEAAEMTKLMAALDF